MFYSEHNRTENLSFHSAGLAQADLSGISLFVFLPLMELTRKTMQGTYPTSSFSLSAILLFCLQGMLGLDKHLLGMP